MDESAGFECERSAAYHRGVLIMSSLLEMRNIDKRYDGPAVLSGLSMSVAAGERVSIRGVSGSGKSTLLYLAAGLETADAGEVLLGAA